MPNSAELTDFELDLVTFLDQQWHLTGELLTASKAQSSYGIAESKFSAALAKKEFRNALEERGITLRTLKEDKDWTSKSLTPIQLAVANTMFDLADTRSQKKKLADLGVETRTYQAWLKDPIFKDYLQGRAKTLIGDNEHEVSLALLDRIRSGEMKAIELYLEMSGQFVRQRATSPGTSGNVNVSDLIVKIIEIVTEEVDDQAALLRIGNRLNGLIAARNVAGALLQESDPIVVPEVARVRTSAELEGIVRELEA